MFNLKNLQQNPLKIENSGDKSKVLLKERGFTLLELMIVVAVIGILASIAFPSYIDYVKRGKAAEATSNLADLRVKMEQFYQDNRTYVGGVCTPASGAKYFTYSCTVQTATTYTISADPASGQGMTGFSFTVNESNAKTSIYDGTAGNCWLTKKDSSC
jgi:type IV pilus assembly protein PilE